MILLPGTTTTTAMLLLMGSGFIALSKSQEVTAPKLYSPDIFDDAGPETSSLEDRIVVIEEKICGTCKGYPLDKHVNSWPVCSVCHCDTMCSVYQDCCADVLLQHNVTYTGEKLGACEAMIPVVANSSELERDVFRMVMNQCPANYTSDDKYNDDSVDKLCEDVDITDIDSAVPVSSRSSGVTYRNKYCAKCHADDEDLCTWRAAISCKNSYSKLTSSASSKSELFQLLTSKETVSKIGCKMQFTAQNKCDIKERGCTNTSFPDVISSCNVTGKWSVYNERMEQACAMYTSVFWQNYKNMFCYLCNVQINPTLERFIMLAQAGFPANAARLSFSALLDFDEEDSNVDDASTEGNGRDAAECSPPNFYDTLQCSCVTPQCSEGKYLTPNGTCKSMFIANVFGYEICVKWDIETEKNITFDEVTSLQRKLGRVRSSSWLLHQAGVGNWCPGDKKVTYHIHNQFSTTGVLESMESSIKSVLDSYTDEAKKILASESVISKFSFIHPCSGLPDTTNPCQNDSSVFFFIETSGWMADGRFELNHAHFMEYYVTNECPYVELSMTDFDVYTQEDSYVFNVTQKNIDKSRVAQLNETMIRVCVSDYVNLIETDTTICRKEIDTFDTWTISGLVSIVCTCISLLFLLLTLIIYLLLPPLRRGEGKNIVTLVVVLITAQAFYEFAIEQYENQTVCKTFGVIIHYTWLAAVFSMNACTSERFYKLCFPLRSRPFFMSGKPYIFATFYTFISPLIIVGTNIITNCLTRGDVGYGSSSVCYINNMTSRIVAFAVPLGILVLVNICLFIITICYLRKRFERNGDTRANTRIGLVACVRLSVVTGLTWLLIFLYELIPGEALSYVITALMGLQGVLFSMSLVLNKRVLSLASDFLSKWRGKPQNAIRSTPKADSAVDRYAVRNDQTCSSPSSPHVSFSTSSTTCEAFNFNSSQNKGD